MKRLPMLTAVAALLLLFSCKNNNNTGLSIPKNAAVVFHIHTPSLAQKLPWDEIKASNWFKEASQKADDSLAKKLLEDPEASGINLRKDLAFFIQRRGRNGVGVFEGSVKDAAAFEAFCKKISKVEKTEKDGEWNLLTADNNSLVAWNDSRFAVIGDVPSGGVNPMMGNSGGGASFSTDSLKAILKEVMAADGKASLFDDDHFASLVKEDGDIHLWVNGGSLYTDAAGGMLSMMKIGSLMEGNVTAATLNFDDGKMSMKARTYYGKEMQEMVKKWDSKKVDEAVLNRIPSNNVIGVIAANLNPQNMQEFFKAAGFDGMINSFLAKQDLTMQDIFSATKGEFVLAFTDLAMKNKSVNITTDGEDTGDMQMHSVTVPQPDFSVLFATNVAQRTSFDKLLNTMTSQTPAPPFPYKLNNDWFVAGNKPQAIDAFIAGNGGGKKEFADKISGHPFGMYLNFQHLLKTNFSEDPTAKTVQTESLGMWKDLVVTGGEFKDGYTTAEAVVNLMDSKTNSLKQLNKYLEKVYQASKQNKVAAMDDAPPSVSDTATVTPGTEAAPQ